VLFRSLHVFVTIINIAVCQCSLVCLDFSTPCYLNIT